ITRLVPNSCTSPVSTLRGWPASAASSQMMNTRGSRRISSASASRTASPYVSSRWLMTFPRDMRGCYKRAAESRTGALSDLLAGPVLRDRRSRPRGPGGSPGDAAVEGLDVEVREPEPQRVPRPEVLAAEGVEG